MQRAQGRYTPEIEQEIVIRDGPCTMPRPSRARPSPCAPRPNRIHSPDRPRGGAGVRMLDQLDYLVTNMFEQGFLFGFLGLGVLITFRFFRFPDLTAEGSYPLGGAVVASLLVSGFDPFSATLIAVLGRRRRRHRDRAYPHQAQDQQHHRRHRRDDRALHGQPARHGPRQHSAADDADGVQRRRRGAQRAGRARHELASTNIADPLGRRGRG